MLSSAVNSRKSFGYFPSSSQSQLSQGLENLALNEISSEMSTFAHKFEVWMTKINNQVLENRRKFQRQMNEGKEKVKEVSKEIEKTRQEVQQINMEKNKMKDDLMNMAQELDQLKQQLENDLGEQEAQLDNDIKILTQKVDDLKAEKKKREQMTVEREMITLPQLKKFEEYLGMTINANEVDETKFTFKYVDEKDSMRDVSFVINVSTHEYQTMSQRQQTIANFFAKRPASKSLIPVDEQGAKKQKIQEKENSSASSMDSTSTRCASTSASPSKASGSKNSGISFSQLCNVFQDIEATTKRLQILDILTQFLVKVIRESPDDLLKIVYLCINKLGPTWDGVELGIGETLLIKSIASATGRPVERIKTDLGLHGDLGMVAQTSRSTQPTMFKPKPLTVGTVFATLSEIAKFTGNSSQNKKIDKICFLLASSRDNEAKYLIRALEGKLRIGLAEQSVIISLAQATAEAKQESISAPEAVEILKQVYSELPNYETIIPVLLEHGIKELPNICKLTPGIPLKPMLAHPTKAITDVLNRFEGIKFTCEYKYDGERAQIHRLPNGKVMIFSRNQENMSVKYPDIIQNMTSVAKDHVKSFVLDTEAVAWDREEHKILPFQVLSTRKRKDVSTSNIKVQVCVFAFDLLYLNGEPLIRKSFEERRRIMYEAFEQKEGEFAFAKHMDGQTLEEIQQFLDESVEGNCEGLMVKTIHEESSYEPSKRSRNWLKVKKDYLEGAGDSLDLVVIGGYTGKGKRTGNYGGFLLACYDDEREEYQAICKIGTGFSDEDLATHGKFFKQFESDVPKSYYSYGEGVKPDVWFDPVQVWEVKTADLSISPIYTAALGHVDSSKGISLRFPRFIRVRDDKGPEQATNATQVAEMYRSQKINHNAFAAEDDEY